jgi:hypothetical protein
MPSPAFVGGRTQRTRRCTLLHTPTRARERLGQTMDTLALGKDGWLLRELQSDQVWRVKASSTTPDNRL